MAPLLIAALAAAPATIDWDAPAGCPSEDEVRSGIEALVGGSELEPLSVHGRVVSSDAGQRWHLTLTLGPDAVRELEADDCAALADAAVVMVGLSLNGAIEEAIDPATVLVPLAPVGPSQSEVGEQARSEPDGVFEAQDGARVSAASSGEVTAASPRRAGPDWGPSRAVLGLMVGVHAVVCRRWVPSWEASWAFGGGRFDSPRWDPTSFVGPGSCSAVPRPSTA